MDTDIVGGISAMITLGRVIVKPLILNTLHVVTYLCRRSDRDRPHDLGPIPTAARRRFTTPLEL